MPHISVVREQRSSMANIHYVPEVNILDTLHPDTKMNIIKIDILILIKQ